MSQILVGIEISEREARIWRFMMESGVFDIKSGNAVLSFDQMGELRSIKRELFSLPVDKKDSQ